MSRFITTLSAGTLAAALIAGLASISVPATAATSDADAAMKKATADCKAEVKEKAKYQDLSWLARRKMVKKCVQDTLANHH
jgi:hypothetical protein